MKLGIRVTGTSLGVALGMIALAETAETKFQYVADPADGFLTSLRCADDPQHVEFIRSGQKLGAVKLRVRSAGTYHAVVNGARLEAPLQVTGAPTTARIPMADRATTEVLFHRSESPP